MALPRGLGASVARLTRESRFVFTGSVEGVARSSLSLLPGGPRTAVVRIDRIHQAAHGLHNQTGQSVTVVFANERMLALGERRVFFTNPILFGETIGVREAGHIEVPDDVAALHELIIRTTLEMTEEELREHVARSAAIVQGRVVSVRRVSDTTALTATEHDPDWWAAVIRVNRSLKGEHEGEVEARYPHSHDIRWYHVPKLQEGQEGIFILHRDGREVGGVFLALIHPEDLLLGDTPEANRIEALV